MAEECIVQASLGQQAQADCPCVKNFVVDDKKRLLTGERAKVGVAALRRREMERNQEWDRQKYDWLSRIIKNEQGRRASFIDKYETFYGPLMPNETHTSDGDEHRVKSSTSPEYQRKIQWRRQTTLSSLFLIVATLILAWSIRVAYYHRFN